jgi:radical SAM protein with 4Fe4S-binding SPASM domain
MSLGVLAKSAVSRFRLFPRRPRTPQIRRPDYEEQRDDLTLQIWADEGYWQVVDGDFTELLKVLESPASMAEVLRLRPDWKAHQRIIRSQLANMAKSGIGTSSPPRAQPPLIENVTINLVTACNLRCRTCYVPAELRNGAKLDASRVLLFLDKLRSCFSGNATLSLLGGEPFLNPEALRAIGLWAKKHAIPCNVSTNGTMLSENLLRVLRETGLKVQVSLDGAEAGTNDAIRGSGVFDAAVKTIARLVENKIPTALCMVCCQENLREIPAYFRLAESLGTTEVRFIPLKKLGHSQSGSLSPAPQLDIVKAICGELDAHPSFGRLCRTDIYSIITTMLRETSRRSTCGSGTQTLLIQADGTVFPCVNTTLPALALGHLSDEPRAVLKKGADFGTTLSLDSLTHPCFSCVVKRWCLAVCPGETLQRERRLARPHWNCEDVKKTLIYLMWRLAREKQTSREHAARSLI